MNKPPFLTTFAISVLRSTQLTASTSRRLTLALIAVVVAGLAASSAAPPAAHFFAGTSSAPPAASRLRARVPARPAVAPRKHASAQVDDATARGRAELNIERRGHAAIALGNGKVLIIGGENERGLVKESELFDLSSMSFSLAAELINRRTDAVAIKLPDGRVMVLGGRNQKGELKSTEIYDSESNSFTRGPKMVHARAGQTATELADGRILIAGGDARGSAEILDPSSLKFSRVASRMQSPRSAHSAILLKSGKVLIAGGLSLGGDEVGSGEIFDPETMHFSATRNAMKGARTRPTLRVLPDGKVQVIGGDDARSMEMFNVEGRYFTAQAHLVPGDNSRTGIAEVMRAQTQAGLFHKTDRESFKLSRTPFGDRSRNRFSIVQDLMGREEALGDVLDRSEYTITELPGSGGTLGGVIVTGGVTGSGKVLRTTAALESSGATVTTDKTDYQPGDTVIISGTGWEPGETVELNVHRDNDQPPDTLYTAVADANGDILNEEMVVLESDLGVTYLLTATGQTSGFTAQTTFTDGNLQTVTLSAPASVTVTQGNSAMYTANVTFGGNTNPCTVTLSVTTVLPTGAVASFSLPNPTTTTNVNFSRTLTITTTAATPPGTYPFTVQAAEGTDCNSPGGTATTTGTLVVNAACSAPTITCPPAVTVECDADVPANATNLATFVAAGGSASPSSLACGPVTVAFISDVPSGSCPKTITRTYRATDAFGNTADCIQIITVDDTVNPTATQGSIAACYQTVAAANQAALDATTALTDNCAPSPTKAVQTSADEACSTSVVIRVQDSCGNFTDYSYNTRVDATAPTATQDTIAACYQSVADANAAALAATTNLDDNCDALNAGNTVTKTVETSATVACSTSVVVRVQDSCGNFTDYTYATRVDTTAPTATKGTIAACYQSVTDANAAALAATTNLDDNCDPLNAGNTVTKTVETSATEACSTSVVIRVQDSCGNFTDYTYPTRVDNTAPTATKGTIAACYQSVTDANAAALAATTNLDDNCDPLNASNTVTKTVETSATEACSTSVVIRVQDSCGNFSDYTYSTRVDGTAPTATKGSIAACYQTVAAANAAALAATTNLDDNCDPLNAGNTVTKVVQTSATVACSTSVVIRVQDSCSNFTDYTYNTRVDNTAPIITCPGNVTVFCAGSSGTAVTYDPPAASDNCGDTPTVVCTPPSGDSFPIGSTPVNCTATDSCGNIGSCNFTVTVQYNFNGFFQPVDNPPNLNAVKAGQSVPLKFQLTCGTTFISDLSAVVSVTSASAACNGDDPGEPVPADDSGASGLHYDFVANQFIYSWKTQKGWANTCRVFILTLGDGTQHQAYFKFKK